MRFLSMCMGTRVHFNIDDNKSFGNPMLFACIMLLVMFSSNAFRQPETQQINWSGKTASFVYNFQTKKNEEKLNGKFWSMIGFIWLKPMRWFVENNKKFVFFFSFYRRYSTDSISGDWIS